jgi:hypothetical protein
MKLIIKLYCDHLSNVRCEAFMAVTYPLPEEKTGVGSVKRQGRSFLLR